VDPTDPTDHAETENENEAARRRSREPAPPLTAPGPALLAPAFVPFGNAFVFQPIHILKHGR
jgi:hypothetical protein